MHFVILGTFLPSKKTLVCDNMYYGFFNPSASPGIPNGELKDLDGNSVIGEIVLEHSQFEFTQVRENGEKIRFSFHREGPIWAGIYAGEKSGRGFTKCVLNPVELNFLVS